MLATSFLTGRRRRPVSRGQTTRQSRPKLRGCRRVRLPRLPPLSPTLSWLLRTAPEPVSGDLGARPGRHQPTAPHPTRKGGRRPVGAAGTLPRARPKSDNPPPGEMTRPQTAPGSPRIAAGSPRDTRARHSAVEAPDAGEQPSLSTGGEGCSTVGCWWSAGSEARCLATSCNATPVAVQVGSHYH
jgi:hypothetical protein